MKILVQIAMTVVLCVHGGRSTLAQASIGATVLAYTQALAQATDSFSASGSFSTGASAAVSGEMSASGSVVAASNTGTFEATATVNVSSGSAPSYDYNPRAECVVSLTRTVCIIPADSTLIGSPVTVVFGSAGAIHSVSSSYSQDSYYNLCGQVYGSASALYTINGQYCGGWSHTVINGSDQAQCAPDSVSFQPQMSQGVVVTLGVPFTLLIQGVTIAGGNISQQVFWGPGGSPTQPTLAASVSATFALGFPSIVNSGGQAITAYSIVDCSSGMGMPLGTGGSLPPQVGAPLCFGDGTTGATPCPCGNSSPYGQGVGCLHSSGSGAKLRAQGHASLAADDVVLLASSMPSTVCLFFQGSGGVTAVPFGDGLFCAGGSIMRLSVQIASAGNASIPAPGDSALSIQGVLPPSVPSSRNYQVWYRDSDVGFCTSATFNLSNALRIDWIP